MFRSDALYTEMNFMIETLSAHLLNQANVSFFKLTFWSGLRWAD